MPIDKSSIVRFDFGSGAMPVYVNLEEVASVLTADHDTIRIILKSGQILQLKDSPSARKHITEAMDRWANIPPPAAKA